MDASIIRGLFGSYKTFVFEFEYTDTDSETVSYICKYAPNGWNEQNTQFVRNRINYGVVRSFTADLAFEKDDIVFIQSYIDIFHYEGDLSLKIWKLNLETMDYDINYIGKVELSKYKLEKYELKVSLTDSDLGAMIENNGDTEYSITPEEYTPFLKDIVYDGIPLVEQGVSYGFIPLYPTSYFPSSMPHVVGDEVFNDVLIGFPSSYSGVISAYGRPFVDTMISSFTDSDLEYEFFQGIPNQMDTPIFTAGRNGHVNLFVTLDCNFEIPLADWNHPDNYPLTYNLVAWDGITAGSAYYSLASGTLVWNLFSWRPDFKLCNLFIETACDFQLSQNDEVYLTLILYRGKSYLGNAQISWSNALSTKLIFTESQQSRTIKAIPLDDLMNLSLSKVTNGKYTTATGLAGFHYLVMINGNFTRGLVNNSMTVKFNDLTDFCVKALGLGYELTNTGVNFDENYTFFNQQVLIQLGEVANFSEYAMTDYLYNTISAGFEPYDTEYLSGKWSMHEKSIFKTPVNSVKNEFNLVPIISGNPFEIEDVVRQSNGEDDNTDYVCDLKLYAIWCKLATTPYEIDKSNYDLANSQVFPYSETIYNLELTPARIIQRNLFNINQSLINDCDTIKKQLRTKNEDYYSAFTGTYPIYEGRDFVIYPRCDRADLPHLFGTIWKLDPVGYSFLTPTELFDLNQTPANVKKLVLFLQDGVKKAGYLDDVGNNPSTEEAKSIKLIKAHLTTEEIDALWQ